MISASVFHCGRWAVSSFVSGLLVVSLFGGDAETVGRRGENRTVLPVNQEVTPLGRQTDLAGLRPQAMALSPDGRRLVAASHSLPRPAANAPLPKPGHTRRDFDIVPGCGLLAVGLTSHQMSGKIA